MIGDKRKMSFTGEEKQYTAGSDGDIISRNQTTVEVEFLKRREAAHEFLESIPADKLRPATEAYIPPTLQNAIFCGHLVTDLDSIAGAIGAAELYGGIPARASEVNSETAFALKTWGVETPDPIEELLLEHPAAGVCLVDHQQTSQLNKSIDVSIFIYIHCSYCNYENSCCY